jgi:hypothetical protein
MIVEEEMHIRCFEESALSGCMNRAVASTSNRTSAYMLARKAKRSGNKKQRLQKEYWEAVAEHQRITKYLKAATGVLPKARCDLLLEFAELAKRKYKRLQRAINRRTGKNAA